MRKNIFIHTRQFLFSLLAVLLLSLTAVPANAIDQINITVNPYDFTMNVAADMEYSDDNGETWNPCTDNQNVEDRQGETLLVRFTATDDSIENDTYTVIVPVRGEAPVLTIDNATESMDSTVVMEYSCDNGMYWAACLDDMSLSELTGTTFLMRYACDGTNPASNNVSVTVPARNATPHVAIDSYAEILTAIVVDGDISLEGHGNKNHSVPVLISEGVTVTAPVVDDPATGEPVSYDAWDIDGTVLVNRGTLRGRTVLGSWIRPGKTPVLLNFGTFHADIYNDEETCQGRGIVVNLETMSVPQDGLKWIYFANLGTFLHGNLAPEGEEAIDVTGDFDPHYYFDFRDSGMYNSGVIRLQGAGADYQSGICSLNLVLRSQINNVGSIEVGEYTDLNNESWFRNFGEIHATGGGVLNNMGGLIDNCSPRSVLDAGNGCYNVGMIQAGPLASVTMPEDASRDGGALMDFSWGSGEHTNTAYVTDAKGLREAMADSSVETVVVHAPLSQDNAELVVVDVVLDEPLVVTKGLAVSED